MNIDLCQVKCYTLKLNVVIYFDFWRGWNSIQVNIETNVNMCGMIGFQRGDHHV